MLDFDTQIALIALGAHIFLTVYVLTKHQGWSSRLNRTFAILSFTFVLWNVGDVFNWRYVFFIGLLLIAPALHTFLIVLVRKRGIRERRINRYLWVWSGLLVLIFAFFGFPERLCRIATIILTIPVGLWSCYFLFRRVRLTNSRQDRLRFGYVLAGLSAGAIGGISSILPFLDITLYSVGTSGCLVCNIFITIAITRHRLIDIAKLAGRIIIVILFTIVFWFLMGILGNWTHEKPYASLLAILVSALVLVVLYEPLRNLIEDQMDRLLSRDRYRFNRQIEEFSRKMNSIVMESSLIQTLAQTLRNSDLIRSFGIYTVSANNKLIIRDGDDIRWPPGTTIDIPKALQELMEYRQGSINRSEIAKDLRSGLPSVIRRHRIALYRILMRFRAQIVFPFIFGEQFLGFLTLGFSDLEVGITRREEESFSAITRQFSAALAHARVVEHEKTQDRLAALGRLASGLAHEIRNPLATIKTTVQYLQPSERPQNVNTDSSLEDDDNAEFFSIIRAETDRLNRFVERFLSFARPGPTAENTDMKNLQELIQRIILTYKNKEDAKNIFFQIQISDTAAKLNIPSDAWTQILTNLIDNSVQVLHDKGTLIIIARTSKNDEDLFLSVEDSGPGIPESDYNRILQPFYTTREGGTGLGLAIVQHIVQNINGKMSVGRSSLGGAIFTIQFKSGKTQDVPEEN